jgi:hypothetical protein
MKICAPALIYVIFSLTHVIIDTFKELYNTAFFKLIVMIMVTFLLNTLCQEGLGIISWIIVFIPFIFMTVIVTLLLYIFGLDAATGRLRVVSNTEETETEDTLIITNVPAPAPGRIKRRVKKNKYNILEENADDDDEEDKPKQKSYNVYNDSSSPAYQS